MERALVAYASAGDCPDRTEATTELRQRAGERDFALAEAKAHAAAKRTNDARIQYLRALTLDAGSTAASEGLAALEPRDAPDVFAGARALREAGFETEAKEALVKVLGEGKATLPKNDDLRSLTDRSGRWDKARTWVKEEVQPIVGDLLALAGVGLVMLTFLNWTLFDAARRGSSRQPVNNPSKLRTWWRNFTRPVLDVKAGHGADAQLFAAQARTLVRKVDVENGTGNIRLATYPEVKLDLSGLETTDDRFKPVVAALKLVAHRDTVTIKASVADEDKTFRRAVLEVVARKEEPRLWTRRVKGGDKTTPTPEIVGSAVGWTLLTAEAMRGRLREDGWNMNTVYGTEKADSYAAYLGAVETFNAGNLQAARSLFTEALRRDRTNSRAHLNLAVSELYDPDPAVWTVGLRRLQNLLAP